MSRITVGGKIRMLLFLAVITALAFVPFDVFEPFNADTVYAADDDLRITTPYLPWGRAGYEYNVQLEASGGTGTGYKFEFVRGTIPEGLSLAADGSGLISGTPVSGGGYYVIFRVTDSAGNTATSELRFVIEAITVRFTVTDNNYTYDGNPHKAKLTPNRSEITEDDYTVYYSGEESQTNAGSYAIRVKMHKLGYVAASVSQVLSIERDSETASLAFARPSYSYDYDMQQHAVSPIITPASIAGDVAVTYTGTGRTVYGPSRTAPSGSGTYRVTASYNGANYLVNNAVATLTIVAPAYDFTVTNTEYTYDGNEKRASVVLTNEAAFTEEEKPGFNVTYDNLATEQVESYESVHSAGSYAINITMTNTNFAVGTVTGDTTLTIHPQTVNFTVSENNIEITEPAAPYRAKVVPDIEGFTGFKVTYVREEERYEDSAPQAGVYSIEIDVTDENYEKGTVTGGDTLTVKLMLSVDFTVSGNAAECAPGIITYGAIITPSVPGFTEYEVTYTRGDNSYRGSVSIPGEYTISITTHSEDCVIGSITGELKFTLTNPLTVAHTGYGNSIAARLRAEADDEEAFTAALAAFKENRMYGGAYYGVKAWSEDGSIDLDSDLYTLFAVAEQLRAEDIKTLVSGCGISAVYAGGADISDRAVITVDGSTVSEWQPDLTKAGIYDIVCSVKDEYTGETKSVTRDLVLLPGRFADANNDRNVNIGDANAISIILEKGISDIDQNERLLLYRRYDVNMDGEFDAGDARAVKNRMRVPIADGFYKWEV